ncbi:cytochrome P450 [Plantactinospora sp. S1510]|uniref:Cytochrome P450 n=1 Tax=Plantactinospora alkalitolerans TaxID=2789879 RepID=A0ABS0H418_9ACTN|nr:cytochrome P450 [Plantactinospora alkalitolerans]MBF9133205.1 cytochrome P450 [Plantactinospora alkalitolerans]
MTVAVVAILAAGVFWSLPRWLPPTVVRLREWIFGRINGTEGIPVPGPLVGAEHFARIYADPAADGRSRGAGLSDLFWYWLAPGPQMHQEHLEPGERYRTVARTTRRVLAIGHRRSADLATAATRRVLDTLPPGRTSHVRLRDLMMPVWAEVYYELVFAEPCPRQARELIVANADDVVTALKGTGLRHLDRRERLTRYLLRRIEEGTCPVVLPEPFTALETAWYVQGAYFNTAVVQMSEAMAHVLLCAAAYPPARSQVDDDDALDRLIDETLRVHPLFGIAHRITSAPIVVDERVTLPAGAVLLFNYRAFQRTGPADDDTFDPDRWRGLHHRDAHFIPYGVTANRACPARGVAPVMLRASTREVLRRYVVTSSASHTRSLPSRGPAYLTPAGITGPGRTRLAAMRLRDRWADVGRSLEQLAFGTWMVVDARRQRLCAAYFEEVGQ